MCFISPSLLDVPFTFLIYIDLSIFFNLNPCFLVNSELITNPIAPLSNNASTITPSCVSILSSSIFTITSLSSFSLFKSQQDVLSITLESIIYLLLLRLNQGVLSLAPYLNYCFVYFLLQLFSFVYCFLYIPVFYPLQFCLLFL